MSDTREPVRCPMCGGTEWSAVYAVWCIHPLDSLTVDVYDDVESEYGTDHTYDEVVDSITETYRCRDRDCGHELASAPTFQGNPRRSA